MYLDQVTSLENYSSVNSIWTDQIIILVIKLKSFRIKMKSLLKWEVASILPGSIVDGGKLMLEIN